MANFPSRSHHAIGKEVRPPKNFSLGRIHWSRSEFGALKACFDHISLIRTRNCAPFFCGLLIHQGTLCQNFKFFINRIDRLPKSFKLGKIHWSKSKFEALGLVLIISPSSDLGIMHHFFMDSLFFKEHSVKVSKFFSTRSTSWHLIQPVHRVNLYGALILESNSYMAWAHGLQISFGLYFGSILGLISDSL